MFAVTGLRLPALRRGEDELHLLGGIVLGGFELSRRTGPSRARDRVRTSPRFQPWERQGLGRRAGVYVRETCRPLVEEHLIPSGAERAPTRSAARLSGSDSATAFQALACAV